jgi:hypothetical protein
LLLLSDGRRSRDWSQSGVVKDKSGSSFPDAG